MQGGGGSAYLRGVRHPRPGEGADLAHDVDEHGRCQLLVDDRRHREYDGLRRPGRRYIVGEGDGADLFGVGHGLREAVDHSDGHRSRCRRDRARRQHTGGPESGDEPRRSHDLGVRRWRGDRLPRVTGTVRPGSQRSPARCDALAELDCFESGHGRADRCHRLQPIRVEARRWAGARRLGADTLERSRRQAGEHRPRALRRDERGDR